LMQPNTAKPQPRYSNLSQFGLYIFFGLLLIVFPLFLTSYAQSLIMKILIYSIFGLSLNILWGYTGLASMGHAAYFGVAGYTAGILIVKLGIETFWITAGAGILLAVVLAALLAFPALRMSGAYFFLVTLAMGELIFSVAEKWVPVTGGADCLVGIPLPNLQIPGFTMDGTVFYYMVVIVFVLCAFLIYRLVNSPFGIALKGIRENEVRMSSLGYNTWLYKYLALIIGGLFAGVAGVLFAHFGGVVSPTYVNVMTSTLGVLIVIIGSCTTVFGPVLGAALVVSLEYFISLYAPERWPLILGCVFVLAVMFLPGGAGVYLARLWKKVFNASTKG